MIAVQLKRSLRVAVALVAAALAVVGVAACGGGGGASEEAVARVGSMSVTKAALDHWMSTIVGGDFYELTGKVAPTGLVSEPPRLAGCVAVLERYEEAPARGKAKAASAVLRRKCEELDSAVRQQTVAYLISADVAVGQGAEQGVTVDESEIKQAFKRLREAEFPTEVELAQYLADRHWTLKDELFLVKRDLLSQKLLARLQQKFKSTGGETALASYARLAGSRWVAKTTCEPGYVVPGCKQYGSQAAAAAGAVPSPSDLIHELAVGVRSAPASSTPAN